jgi:hypothetical protein
LQSIQPLELAPFLKLKAGLVEVWAEATVAPSSSIAIVVRIKAFSPRSCGFFRSHHLSLCTPRAVQRAESTSGTEFAVKRHITAPAGALP